MKQSLVTRKKVNLKQLGGFLCLSLILMGITTLVPLDVLATDYKADVVSGLEGIIDVITFIFQACGAVLGVYAIAQLILNNINDNPDAQLRATKLLVTAVAAVGLPFIVKSLDLVGKLT